ncbi:MAG: CPBP family intramembrane glutamic endopeptidase, partial [Chloroflexota bacterium]
AAAALVAGAIFGATQRAPVTWSWAAAAPAAVLVAVGTFAGPVAGVGVACASVGSPVLWAVVGAAAVVAAVAMLGNLLAVRRIDVGLRRPAKAAIRLAWTGGLALAVISVAGVLLFVRPAFGLPTLDTGGVGFLVPAILWSMATAIADEMAFRGALQLWLARTLGPWPAVLGQAAIYGVTWGVGEGSPVVGVLAACAALVLGSLVVRTRSLLVPLAWHAAFGIGLYALLACRVAG